MGSGRSRARRRSGCHCARRRRHRAHRHELEGGVAGAAGSDERSVWPRTRGHQNGDGTRAEYNGRRDDDERQGCALRTAGGDGLCMAESAWAGGEYACGARAVAIGGDRDRSRHAYSPPAQALCRTIHRRRPCACIARHRRRRWMCMAEALGLEGSRVRHESGRDRRGADRHYGLLARRRSRGRWRLHGRRTEDL